MKVSEWIRNHRRSVIIALPDLSMEEVLDRFLAEPCLRDLYVVDDDHRLIGHISHKRIAELVLAQHRPVHTRRQIMERVACGSARELMQTDFPSAHPDEDLDDVLHRQLEQYVEDMPVIAADGSLLGAVNLSAVLRASRLGELNNH